MYQLKTEASFDGAHFLTDYDGSCENLHGHRWRVVAYIRRETLDTRGEGRDMVLDFREFKRIVRDEVSQLDHTMLVEEDSLSPKTIACLEDEGFSLTMLPFRTTAENLAHHLAGRLRARGLPVSQVDVYETPLNCATYVVDGGGDEGGAQAGRDAETGGETGSSATETPPPTSENVRALLKPDPRLTEEVVGSRQVWQGRIFSVETLGVRLPDGGTGSRELVRHHGGAGVCAVRDGRMCLVRQYRVAFGRMSLEIPAGKLEAGENPADCAARELLEETGLVAGRLEAVAHAAGSIGFTDETTHIFLAHDLSCGTAHPDEGEFVDTVWVPVRDVVQAAHEGVIQDGKTIIAALVALERGLA